MQDSEMLNVKVVGILFIFIAHSGSSTYETGKKQFLGEKNKPNAELTDLNVI